MARTFVPSLSIFALSFACTPDDPPEVSTESGTESSGSSTTGPGQTEAGDTTTTGVADSTGGSSSSDGGASSSSSSEGDGGSSSSSDGGSSSSSDGGSSSSSDGGSSSSGSGSESSSSGGVPCMDDADCAAFDGPCAAGVCTMGTCEAQDLPDATPCSSGDLCQLDEVCTMGMCGGGMPVDCSMLDGQCTMGVCDPADGLCDPAPANEGGACDDGTACTYDDICMMGTCAGTSDPLFEETFVDNSQGWMLDGKWEIDVATISAPGSLSGGTDPDMDHTATMDEGLAGVLIGGLSGPPGHPTQYMTSPVIDLSVVDPAATKEFRYWRHMTSTDAFMTETIDLWNGASWDNVYTLAGAVADPDWVEFVVDISAYTNADFQIRFGHQIDPMLPVGPAEPSWSVDDVSISPVCP